MKDSLLRGLHEILSMNVIGNKQYNSRYIGFRSEFQTTDFLEHHGYSICNGGYIVPTQKGEDKNDYTSIYFNVGNRSTISKMETLFRKLSPLSFRHMFLIVPDYNLSTWGKTKLDGYEAHVPEPNVEVLIFSQEESSFEEYKDGLSGIATLFTKIYRRSPIESINEDLAESFQKTLGQFSLGKIVDLYTERYLFDGLIGFGRERGIPTDIDCVIFEEKKIRFVEIKEKDLSKRPPVGFGMDTRRISQISRICRRTSTDMDLVVRHISDQDERNLIGYKRIDFHDFYRLTKNRLEIEGGHGMRSKNSSNPTKICPIENFQIM